MLNTTDRKRLAILESAKRAFLRNGFAGSNLDEIAASASVSKVTIYSHFGSKENLFLEVIEWVVAQRSGGGPPLDATVAEDDLADALTAIAVDLIRTVQDPDVVGLRRVLISEQPRHPALAANWRASAVLATVRELSDYFAALERRGLLTATNSTTVATQFLWMLIGDVLDAALLDPTARANSAASSAKYAVRTLLAAHGRPRLETGKGP